MEAMEDGVELHTPPTRMPPPLRDILVSGKSYICLICLLFSRLCFFFVFFNIVSRSSCELCICQISEMPLLKIVKQLFFAVVVYPWQPQTESS